MGLHFQSRLCPRLRRHCAGASVFFFLFIPRISRKTGPKMRNSAIIFCCLCESPMLEVAPILVCKKQKQKRRRWRFHRMRKRSAAQSAGQFFNLGQVLFMGLYPSRLLSTSPLVPFNFSLREDFSLFVL